MQLSKNIGAVQEGRFPHTKSKLKLILDVVEGEGVVEGYEGCLGGRLRQAGKLATVRSRRWVAVAYISYITRRPHMFTCSTHLSCLGVLPLLPWCQFFSSIPITLLLEDFYF